MIGSMPPIEAVAATGMVTWTDVATAIGALIAAVVITLGLAFAFLQVRSADKTRDIAALTSRSERWEEPSLVEARHAVSNIGDARELWNHLNTLEPGKSVEWYLFMRIPHFFEDMGIACLQAKALRKESVYELFAPPIERYWGLYRTFMEEYRKKEGDQRIFEWFERVAQEMDKIKEKKAKTRRRR
jgi:hypothetical protein